MMKKAAMMLVLAMGAMGSVSLLTLAPETAWAQKKPDDDKKIGAKVGKPLQQALEAINKNEFDPALAALEKADAVEKKTAYEQFQINEMYGYIHLKRKKYAEALRYYERNQSSGQLDAGAVNDRLKLLAQLNFQIRNLAKATGYGQQWLKATGANDIDMLVLVGQAYYLDKDYANTIKFMGQAVNTAQKAGRKPDENWLLIIQQSYFAQKDAAGVNRMLTQLVRYYPKKDYWDSLTANLLRSSSGEDRMTLNIYRLMFQLDVLKTADDYAEMAIIALQQGLPGEALAVMEHGYAKKLLDTSGDTARSKRIYDQAKTQAAGDRNTLDQQEKEALKSTTGQADYAVAQAFFSFGQNERAVAALTRALEKGGVRSEDEAWLLLGQSHVRLKNGEDARKAFAKVQGEEFKELARIWSLYAAQI